MLSEDTVEHEAWIRWALMVKFMLSDVTAGRTGSSWSWESGWSHVDTAVRVLTDNHPAVKVLIKILTLSLSSLFLSPPDSISFTLLFVYFIIFSPSFCFLLIMLCFFFPFIPLSLFSLSPLFSVLPRLQEDPPTGVSGAPSENNIMLWNAVIFGWVMLQIQLRPAVFEFAAVIVMHRFPPKLIRPLWNI